MKKCPECSSENIITDPTHAELYCGDCGIVIAENIVDFGPEWRVFDAEQASKRVRTGPPMSYRIYDKGLGTPTPRLPTQIRRLQWATTDMDSNEKNLSFALSEISRMASALGLPYIIKEEASVLYRKAVKQKLIKGRSIEELVSATLYIACRQYGVPRTLKEVAKVSKMPLRKIRRAYIFLLKKLEIKLSLTDPASYIPRFCSELGLSNATREKAIEILRKDKEFGATKSWGPTGTAAAAIYIAAILSGKDEYRTEKEIAKVAGTTEVTIRNRCKELGRRIKLNADVLSSSSQSRQKGDYFMMGII